jgi:hypothetical protein
MKTKILILLQRLLSAGVATSFVQSGTTDPLKWTLNKRFQLLRIYRFNSTLTISGTGAMPVYSYPNVPWHSYRSSITKVIIKDGVTSIGNGAFSSSLSLTEVTNLKPAPQDISSNIFRSVELRNVMLYVPVESIEAYKTADVWEDFGTITAYTPAAINAPPMESDIP